jgi:hypothetical protein
VYPSPSRRCLYSFIVSGVNPVEWYNGDPYTEADLGAVSRYNRIVGPIELRQMRVSNQSCHARRFLEYGHRFVVSVRCAALSCPEVVEVYAVVGCRYDTKDFTCYAEFRLKDIWDDSTEDRAPFGPPSAPRICVFVAPQYRRFAAARADDTEKYKWSSGHGPLYGLYGFGPDNYGNGGYVVYFNSTQAEAKVNELFTDRFGVRHAVVCVCVCFPLPNAVCLGSQVGG